MKTLQTIGGLGAKSGGTSTCTYELLAAIHGIKPEPQVDLLTSDVVDRNDCLMGCGEKWIKAVPNDYRTPLSLSKNMLIFLENSDYDVYHTNGMWMYVNHITCSVARKKRKPYVITPHGMLYPNALARSAWKKWPLRKLWFNKDVLKASCVHVTCETEMNHVRNFGYKGPIAVIPNPLFVPEYINEIYHVRKRKKFNARLEVGFLGRLHPIKVVENLLRGVALRKQMSIDVFIIGSGDKEYEKFLHKECAHLGISEQVKFLGFLNGFDKFAQLAQLDALFVPSDMENFGMIVPEALVVGTPVMASLGTPWDALNSERCGWWRDNSPESIAKVIDELYELSPEEHYAMGLRGREYVLSTFAAGHVAEQMMLLYKWLVGEAYKPEFVFA